MTFLVPAAIQIYSYEKINKFSDSRVDSSCIYTVEKYCSATVFLRRINVLKLPKLGEENKAVEVNRATAKSFTDAGENVFANRITILLVNRFIIQNYRHVSYLHLCTYLRWCE